MPRDELPSRALGQHRATTVRLEGWVGRIGPDCFGMDRLALIVGDARAGHLGDGPRRRPNRRKNALQSLRRPGPTGRRRVAPRLELNANRVWYVRAQPALTWIKTAANMTAKMTRTPLISRTPHDAHPSARRLTPVARLTRALRTCRIAFVQEGRALCGLALLTLSLSACTMQTTPQFDSATWKSQRGADAQNNRRGSMVAAVEKAVDTGMSRDQVIALLGEPDSTDAATSTDLYELGVAQYGIDEEFYQVQYQDGKVASHRWGRR